MTYDNWKTTEPDPGDYEPFGECHWCGYRAQLYRMWLLTGVEGWFCRDCAEELETESRIKHRPVVRSNKPIYRRCGERITRAPSTEPENSSGAVIERGR